LISGVVFHGSPWGVEMPLIITGSGSISYDRRVTWYAVLHVPCEPFRVRDIQMILAVLGEEVGRSRISFFLRDLVERGYLRRERVSPAVQLYQYWLDAPAIRIRNKLQGEEVDG